MDQLRADRLASRIEHQDGNVAVSAYRLTRPVWIPSPVDPTEGQTLQAGEWYLGVRDHRTGKYYGIVDEQAWEAFVQAEVDPPHCTKCPERRNLMHASRGLACPEHYDALSD